jgi:hypothetical protein
LSKKKNNQSGAFFNCHHHFWGGFFVFVYCPLSGIFAAIIKNRVDQLVLIAMLNTWPK